MPKQKSKSKKTLPLTLARLGRLNVMVVAVFVLGFVAIGAWYVGRSEAATWYCTDHEYYVGEPHIYHGYCVYQIQYAMQVQYHYLASKHMPNIGPVTGVYDGHTSNIVWQYQQIAHAVGGADGVVGAGTWTTLCRGLFNQTNSEAGAKGNSAWYIRDLNTYSNLGCSNPTFHSWPIN